MWICFHWLNANIFLGFPNEEGDWPVTKILQRRSFQKYKKQLKASCLQEHILSKTIQFAFNYGIYIKKWVVWIAQSATYPHLPPLTGRTLPPPHPSLFLGGPRCLARSVPMVANKVRLIFFRLN